jgi:hypothetical protein
MMLGQPTFNYYNLLQDEYTVRRLVVNKTRRFDVGKRPGLEREGNLIAIFAIVGH